MGRFKLGSILRFQTELMFEVMAHNFCVCIYIMTRAFYAKRIRWRGWDSNPRTPKGRDHSSLFFLSLYVLREEMVPRKSDLESCAFDQASLPLRSFVLPVKPYFIVAAGEIRLNLLGASTIC